MAGIAKLLIQLIWSSLLMTIVLSLEVDKKGYVVYCPCMGMYTLGICCYYLQKVKWSVLLLLNLSDSATLDYIVSYN